MTTAKKKNPDKRAHGSMVRFNDSEFGKVRGDADAVRQDLAAYLRDLAMGANIRVPRSLPASDRKLLATAMSMLAEAICRLDRIVNELELGDVPVNSEIIASIQMTTSALKIFEDATERLRTVADTILSELDRA
jgi:hypothetical protein